MTARLLTFVLLITFSLSSLGQTKLYFPNLTRTSIDTTYNAVFAFDPKYTHFINLPGNSLDKKNPLYRARVSTLAVWQLIAKFKNENLKDSLAIFFSEGNSYDPGYEVTTGTGRLIRRFPCVEFYINGSGTIYTSGHVDNMYNRKRKFQIQNDTIVETSQPYNYVGLKGKTLKAIILYKDKVGNEIVAQLPKDYEIEILLAETATKEYELERNYLVKTDFGLVGWFRLTNEDLYGTIIKDFYYAGD